MKRMSRSRRKNGGFSLVELICGIGILSCITAAVATILIVSAKSYRNGMSDTKLQQEAQFTVNRIGGLIVNATRDVRYFYEDGGSFVQIADGAMAPAGTDRMLSIVNEDVTYNIVLHDGNLTYSEVDTANAAVVYASNLMLAEGVSEFNADVSDFATDRNVRMQMTFHRDNREFAGNYNVSSRNGMIETDREEKALIVAPAQIVLEPSQVYSMSYSVMGIADSSVNLTLSGATAGATSVTVAGNGLVGINVARTETGDAQGNIYLTLSTVACKEDGITPLDTRVVIIHIRRVTDIHIVNEPLAVDKYAAGDIISLKAEHTGFYLNKVPGADYDMDYADTRKVVWDYAFQLQIADGVYADADFNTYCEVLSVAGTDARKQIKLKREMPRGSRIVVTVLAAHPEGTISGAATNKTGIKYATVTDSWEYMRESGGIVWREGGFKRGNDNMDFETSLSLADKNNLRDSNANGNPAATFAWFYRSRISYEDGSKGDWSQYYVMREGGFQNKINADETRIFLPQYAYEVQIMGAIVTLNGSNMLYWPVDDSLLTAGTGFESWTPGWIPGSEQTPMLEYSGIVDVGAVSISYKANPAYGIPEGAKSIGSADSPVLLYTGSVFSVDLRAENLEFGHFQNNFKVHLQKWNGTSWNDCAAEQFGLQEGASIRIDNINHANGMYRLGSMMKNGNFKTVSGDILHPAYHDISVDCDFGNPYTGEGIIYVRFQ